MIPVSLRKASRYLWREWIRPLGLFLAILLPLKSAVADYNYVPSGSMVPTIQPGELVWINKLAYDLKVPFTTWRLATWEDPARGDIVVLFSPQDGIRLVKRVIGLPGDVIEMRNERLFLNGQPLDYTAVSDVAVGKRVSTADEQVFHEHLPERTHAITVQPNKPALRSFGPLTVQSGHYFVLGDSRDNSNDSRFFGAVSRRQIVGRASTVLGSVDLENYLAPRWARFFKGLQ